MIQKYLVQSGDSIASIALRFGMDVNELLSINSMSHFDSLSLYDGQELKVKIAAVNSSVSSSSSSSDAAAAATVEVNNNSGGVTGTDPVTSVVENDTSSNDNNDCNSVVGDGTLQQAATTTSGGVQKGGPQIIVKSITDFANAIAQAEEDVKRSKKTSRSVGVCIRGVLGHSPTTDQTEDDSTATGDQLNNSTSESNNDSDQSEQKKSGASTTLSIPPRIGSRSKSISNENANRYKISSSHDPSILAQSQNEPQQQLQQQPQPQPQQSFGILSVGTRSRSGSGAGLLSSSLSALSPILGMRILSSQLSAPSSPTLSSEGNYFNNRRSSNDEDGENSGDEDSFDLHSQGSNLSGDDNGADDDDYDDGDDDAREAREKLRRIAALMKSKRTSNIVLRTPKLLKSEKGSILSSDQLDVIHRALPVRHYNKDWDLVYSSREHGISLATLYRSVGSNIEETVIVVQTSKGQIFGGYASERWHPTSRYYGTGESLVFTFNPGKSVDEFEGLNDNSDHEDELNSESSGSEKAHHDDPNDTLFIATGGVDMEIDIAQQQQQTESKATAKQFKFFRSTRFNDYFQSSTEKYIGFGGGGSGAAFRVDSDFMYGITNRCPTFNNDLLCDMVDERFSIYCVELWTFHSNSSSGKTNRSAKNNFEPRSV